MLADVLICLQNLQLFIRKFIYSSNKWRYVLTMYKHTGEGSQGKAWRGTPNLWLFQPEHFFLYLSYYVLEVASIFCLKNIVPKTRVRGWGERWYLDYLTIATALCSFGSSHNHTKLRSQLLGRSTKVSQFSTMFNGLPWNPEHVLTIIFPTPCQDSCPRYTELPQVPYPSLTSCSWGLSHWALGS